MNLLQVMTPELILIVAACALFLLGISRTVTSRKLAPVIAIVALLVVVVWQVFRSADQVQSDATNVLRVYQFADYIKLLTAAVGILLVLLAWPTRPDGAGNSALHFGSEAGEFFALMLLSITGVFLVAGANDLILLFLGIELASLPTYIMVSISRPLPAAQEAGVKYFFLGAMSAAIMLLGFTYLYGTTGTTSLTAISNQFFNTTNHGKQLSAPTNWQLLAIVLTVAGVAFKLAAFPLHFYAGDVYQGAATPVTAFLSFVPKTSGMVALIKILFAVGGGVWAIPHELARLLWIIAVLTMSVGNVLGLLQLNVKRVLAYSSIAHSGYMLVGIATLAAASGNFTLQVEALHGVLFYLAAYGIMNAAAFGVLMLLPARGENRSAPATSAETFEDLAGAGRDHPALGLAMAIACFSLIGLPLTVGFFGKFYLVRPALSVPQDHPMRGAMVWLVVIMMTNAAVSAAYYLRINATMFLRPEPTGPRGEPGPAIRSMPATLAICLSAAGTILFGAIFPATEVLDTRAETAANIEQHLFENELPAQTSIDSHQGSDNHAEIAGNKVR
jgi:NADH-quinone oxidoreductase subunit N